MTSPIGGISIPSFPTVSAIGSTPDVTQTPAVSSGDNGFAGVLTDRKSVV